jgi:hypothetical protein
LKVVIHVGLPKAASSFLQRHIFPNIKDSKVFGNLNTEFNFDIKLDKDKLNIISSEQLFGRPNSSKKSAGGYEIAKRLQGMFPNAKVIVVLRKNRDKWIKSLYGEYIKAGGAAEFDSWYENVFDKDSLDQESYVKHLRSLFDEVLVCSFEDLIKDHKKFVSDICNFIGVEVPKYENKRVNLSLNNKQIKRWRRMNALFNSRYSPHKGIFPEFMNPLLYYRRLMRKMG